ncbi:hypothetical protein GCM10022245_51690 [Streptomyces mayteni]
MADTLQQLSAAGWLFVDNNCWCRTPPATSTIDGWPARRKRGTIDTGATPRTPAPGRSQGCRSPAPPADPVVQEPAKAAPRVLTSTPPLPLPARGEMV